MIAAQQIKIHKSTVRPTAYAFSVARHGVSGRYTHSNISVYLKTKVGWSL